MKFDDSSSPSDCIRCSPHKGFCSYWNLETPTVTSLTEPDTTKTKSIARKRLLDCCADVLEESKAAIDSTLISQTDGADENC